MTLIVDHRGQPLQREQLQEGQTSRLAQLHSEYQNHPSRGLTPPKLATILQLAERGDITAQHELFADMEEKDAHMFSEMQKRRLAPQTLDWDIVPPANASAAEKALADYAKEMFAGISDIEDVLFDLTDAIGHGFAALELAWSSIERNLLPSTITHRPQGWFCLSVMPDADRNELRLRNQQAEGETLWPFGWILHKHRATSGYVTRSGLFRVLAWPYIFKNYAVRDLAEFLEIYGLPLRLGTYHTTATKEDKATLLRAVVGIGHDAAAIIPQGMAIDFKDAAKGEDSPFNSMISLMERSMSKAILGGTLTSGEGEHGTQALGNVHNEVRHDLKKADARQLASTLTAQLVYPILAVNKGLTDMRRCPRFVFDTQEPEDLKLYADALPKLVGIGMRIPPDWAHDKLKIPQAQDAEPVLQTAAPSPAPVQEGQREELRAHLAAQSPTAEGDELDALAAEMLGEWEGTLGELIEPVEQALAAATSFEDFQAALETQIAGIDPERLTEMLARGTFAARIWARLNTSRRPPAEK